jgi:hypothetical protein
MFSASANRPVTLTVTPSSPSADIAPNTAAAPLMSDFMVFIDVDGFSDSPPESKVMPLPTRTTWPSTDAVVGS